VTTRALAFFLSATIAISTFAQDASPNDSLESFDIEPPSLIPNRANDQPLSDTAASSASGDVDLAKLEKNFERAKKAAESAERFCKIGALSKLESEQRALRVVRLECDLENARLAQTQAELDTRRSRVDAGEISKAQLVDLEAAVARATESAQAAITKRERAEMAAAEANVQRQRKLVALGSAGKSDVARAEAKLAEMKTPKD
jgi:hypothetical protein